MKGSLWKSDGFLGVLVVLLTLAVVAAGGLRGLERWVYAGGMRLSPPRLPSHQVVVVGIDARSPSGAAGWSRDRLAKLVDKIGEAKPAVIGITLPFDIAENAQALHVARALRQSHRAAGKSVLGVLAEAEAGIDTDGALAKAMSGPVGVVLASHPRRSALVGLAGTASHDWRRLLARWRSNASLSSVVDLIGPPDSRPPTTPNLAEPIPRLASAAAGAGYLSRYSRGPSEPLLFESPRGEPVPSFALAVVARSEGLSPESFLSTLHGTGPEASSRTPWRVYPYHYDAQDGRRPFATYAAARVIHDGPSAAAFAGKVVLIGLMPSVAAEQTSPPGTEPVVAVAGVVSALLNRDLYRVPPWVRWMQWALLGVVTAYLVLLSPHLRTGTAFAFSALLLFVILNLQLGLMIGQSLWTPLTVPAAALLAGTLALLVKRRFDHRLLGFVTQLGEANQRLGRLYQEQGQLDSAFERFRRCTPSDELLESLYGLGLDYERRRQFNKAVAVFRHIDACRRRFRDAADRVRRNEELERRIVLGKSGGAAAGDTLVLDEAGLQKPMLGRYQVERELGRGAMGLVYLGRDPKIGRTVAIKTMALSQEFEGGQLEAVKERFFREAEAAGRLNHPNIVTVYDVGEEQDLAYIAMDYLRGSNLAEYTDAEHLLPLATTIDIGIQVAEALDYAHKNNVVHRDIKPANVVYDEENGTVKVTDFGVACLTDSSKTTTGTVLGSPSYMSPEQLAGQKLDGRSDLFSLGIMLFQLLTGRLPFEAESLASLMFKIANDKHPDITKLRSTTPTCLVKIVNKALQKSPERRYQGATRMAAVLRQCRDKLGARG